MGTRTITIKECDRCGTRIEEGPGSAEMSINWNGRQGAPEGAANPIVQRGQALLCAPCTTLFLDLLKPPAEPARTRTR